MLKDVNVSVYSKINDMNVSPVHRVLTIRRCDFHLSLARLSVMLEVAILYCIRCMVHYSHFGYVLC